MLTSCQARGKWMIPAYKGVLYLSFGSSMYMMTRLLLVGFPFTLSLEPYN
jgi:hypothetical protein